MSRARWVVATWLPFAACLSSSPPLPAVRWFDPRPAASELSSSLPPVELRVTAAGHLGREFVVRTAPRELVFDGQHGWIDEPAPLVAAALAGRMPVRSGGRPLSCAVTTFELDVQQEPMAVVGLVVQHEHGRQDVHVRAPAADRSPAALAAAMADALDQAAVAVAEALGAEAR